MKTMVFSSKLMHKVRSGEKVMTRRKVSFSKKGKIVERYKVGDICAVSLNRFHAPVGRIKILEIRYVPLSRISELEARLEGFASEREFYDAWEKMHGSYNPWGTVAVVLFKYLGDLEYGQEGREKE